MDSLHNFPSNLKSYLEKRKISLDSFSHFKELWLIQEKNHSFLLAMRNLDWEIIGRDERFFEPIIYEGKTLKTKCTSWSKVWAFFSEIQLNKKLVITEGNIDALCVPKEINHIGIQWVQWLYKLVSELLARWVPEILLIIDNDEPADLSISKLLELDSSQLAGIFDCREVLWYHKDLNDFIVAGGEITIEKIEEHKKSLEDFKTIISKLITANGKVNHSQFAKYLVEKLNLASVDWTIFMYKEGVWKIVSKHLFENIIMNQLDMLLWWIIQVFTNTDKNNIHDFVTVYAENQELRKRLLYQWDTSINLKDCVLNPATLETTMYSKSDFKFQKFTFSHDFFDSYQEPELFLIFLNQILNWYTEKDKVISFIQEFMGSLMIWDSRRQRALLCYWSGSNGKWVLLNICRALLGWAENVSSVGLHEINNSQNLYNLFWKLANIDSDMQQDVQLDSGLIKKIVSWEPIVGKILYKQPLEYIPFCRLLIACNEQPYLKTIDNSIRRRFVYLHLKNTFYTKQDPDLTKKICADIGNVFVWAVKWAFRLVSRWDFDVPQELTDNLDNFIKENDTTELFIDEWVVEKDIEAKIYNKELYLLYKFFCYDCWYKALSQKNFNKRLRDKWYEDFRDWHWRGFLWLKENKPF